jgi:hypothetical protein
MHRIKKHGPPETARTLPYAEAFASFAVAPNRRLLDWLWRAQKHDDALEGVAQNAVQRPEDQIKYSGERL